MEVPSHLHDVWHNSVAEDKKHTGANRLVRRWGHTSNAYHARRQTADGVVKEMRIVLFGGFGADRRDVESDGKSPAPKGQSGQAPKEKAFGTDGRLNSVLEFDVTSGLWSMIECTGDVPKAREHHAGVIVHVNLVPHLCVHGGRQGPMRPMQDLFALNLETRQWTRIDTIGSKPPCLWRHTMVNVNGAVLVFGGLTSNEKTLDGSHALPQLNENHVYRLDVGKSTDVAWEWTKMVLSETQNVDDVPAARHSHSATVFSAGPSAKMMILGGLLTSGAEVHRHGAAHDLLCHDERVYLFDAESVTWTVVPTSGSVPPPLYSHSCTMLNDSVALVLGGAGPQRAGPMTGRQGACSKLSLLDLSSKTWITPSWKVVTTSASALANGSCVLQNESVASDSKTDERASSAAPATVEKDLDFFFFKHGAVTIHGPKPVPGEYHVMFNGGGGLCFSFGASFNEVCWARVTLNEKPPSVAFHVAARKPDPTPLLDADLAGTTAPKAGTLQASPPAGTAVCSVCESTFVSRNRLYKHLKLTGHNSNNS